MIYAYILISLGSGVNPSEMASTIMGFDEVDNLHLVYGEWDIIARIKTESMVSLRDFTLEHLLKLNGIARTVTLIVADESK